MIMLSAIHNMTNLLKRDNAHIHNRDNTHMLMHGRTHLLRKCWILSAVLGILVVMSGCKGFGVYDDLDECPRGVVMRFVFDYNLEFANSFPNQVHCLSVYLFDEDGNLLERRTETSEVLKDENWRMTFDIPAGNYQVIAYGGMECDLGCFSHTRDFDDIRAIRDLDAAMKSEFTGDEDKRPKEKLHDLYHGLHSFTVTEGTQYDSTTVHLVRDTNNIRIVLQQLDNSPVNDSDFRFEIMDDNTCLDWKNDIVRQGALTYVPWITGTTIAGVSGLADNEGSRDGSDTHPVQVAFAEFSVSRLIRDSSFTWLSDNGNTCRGPRLRIVYKRENKVVADLPLNNYLLLLKGEYLKEMGSQEFLDRANNFSLIFFLDHNHAWVQVNIVVEDWTVRVNDVDEL